MHVVQQRDYSFLQQLIGQCLSLQQLKQTGIEKLKISIHKVF
jgi:hypothetical protein